ncbi:Nif11-like leader peptide family natural product precursor [Synechococcus sp. RS9916]|uniref:Nif11-like leader peptide family natural product precursor n=1 Tax=Synechococcus sp. RS9916 TaxID=221359 RepID=UPI0000E536FB|nr:Nif11-like leader peptide family natural product precursor [Synechococcus sp. RS9916]EAU74587.1 possible SAP domain [Synechococcus sp. RS9916]
MSEEQLKAFLEKVKADTGLQEKLKAASDANAVAAIAQEAGFSISADDLKKAESEIVEEVLEGVAGGLAGGGCSVTNQSILPGMPAPAPIDHSLLNSAIPGFLRKRS